MKSDSKIDFIGIGVPKAGTTWLSFCLREHPEICSTLPKETDFFLSKHNTLTELELYLKKCKNNVLRGEFSLYYLYSKVAREKIKKHCPDVKLFVVLRDPIERARSLYNYRKRNGKPIASTFEKEIKANPAYIEHGNYWKYLKSWTETFGENSLHIMIYEDLNTDPKTHIQELYSFLGVDPTFIAPSLFERKNVTSKNKYRSFLFNKVIMRAQRIVGENRVLAPFKPLLRFLKVEDIIRSIKRLNHTPHKRRIAAKKEPLESNTERWLKEYYQKDKEALETYLDRTLSAWK